MTSGGGVVIVGAGHGGVQAAASLRDEGYGGTVTLIGDEPDQPYHRPPLSKTYVTDDHADLDPLRGPRFYESVDLILGDPVVEIAHGPGRVYLASGRRLPFAHLVLATGSRNRSLPIEGADLDGVLSLRFASEARELRGRLAAARSVVVIGGGFIGMEFAAAAARLGVDITLLEAAPRTMGRAVTEVTSRHLEANQRTCGVSLRLAAGVAAIEGRAGSVEAVRTTDGQRHLADLVLVGVGAVANNDLAADAGLRTGAGPIGGIVVDEQLITSHPDISAIGDCALFPAGGTPMRLESIQNAVDQGRYVAARIAGNVSNPYAQVPWFWSDQGPVKLQIAGLVADADRIVIRGDPESGRFSLVGLTDGRVVMVESINKPGDHMAARRMIATGALLSEEEAADTSFSLKSAVSRAEPAA